MGTAWYRDPAWTVDAAAEFERRLGRSRASSRPQYLRIKALAVLRAGDTANGELLLRRVLDEHPDSTEIATVLEQLADLCVATGRAEEAEAGYREILARWPDQRGTTGEVAVKLAELLLEGDRDAAVEGARLLDETRDGLVLAPSIARWEIARARAADVAGVPVARTLRPPPDGDWGRLTSALAAAGVAGADDVGRFVSNTEWFEASTFDERAAMPVLLELLPTLDDPNVVGAVAGHLGRPWARPAAFEPLVVAFERWATRDGHAGWALGNALGTAAGKGAAPTLVALANDRRYGTSRQMVVAALARFKDDPTVAPTLESLVEDPDVALHAMGALRRVVGNDRALPLLRRVRDNHADPRVRSQATAQIRKAEKARGR